MSNMVDYIGTNIDWNLRTKREGTKENITSPTDRAWFNEDVVDRIALLGANLIDVHINRAKIMMPTRGIVDESFFSDYLDMWVKWVTSRGLYCIINVAGFAVTRTNFNNWGAYLLPTWLYEPYGRKPTTFEEQAEVVLRFWDTDHAEQQENRLALSELWKYIANRYSDNSLVLFNLINEPMANCKSEMDTTRSQHLGNCYTRMMEYIIDQIGNRRPIIVDRPFLLDTSHIQPIDRDIIWEEHAYVTPSRNVEQWKAQLNNVDTFGKPLFIGEYGIERIEDYHTCDFKTVIPEQVDFLDQTAKLLGRVYHQYGFTTYYNNNILSDEEVNFVLNSVLGTVSPQYPCLYCSIIFHTQAELDAHIQAEHHFSCPYCDKVFPTQAELDAHIASEHPTPPPKGCFIATACGTSNAHLDTLRSFRDRYLPNRLVDAYYLLSPPVADRIRKHENVKTVIRGCVEWSTCQLKKSLTL